MKAALLIISHPLASKEKIKKQMVSLDKKAIRGPLCGTFFLPALIRMLQRGCERIGETVSLFCILGFAGIRWFTVNCKTPT